MDRNVSTEGGQTPDVNPMLHAYKEWVLKTPFITRTSLLVIVTVYLLSWIIDLSHYLSNIPYYVIFYFQLYRLILSPFVGNSILAVIIMFLFFPTMSARLEFMVSIIIYIILDYHIIHLICYCYYYCRWVQQHILVY